MNEEIEEIIRSLKDLTWLDYKEMNKLLKYITNLQEENKELKQEIERLNNIIKGLDNTIENLNEVLQQKENIIKEVREELNKIDSATYQGDTDKKTYYKYEQTRIQKLLQILDKENKDEI